MFRLKPVPNKQEIHLSFYNDEGKLITEYIPKEHGYAVTKIFSFIFNLRLRHKRPVYYWHMRHFLEKYERKAEDLRFIDHVRTFHEGNPPSWRENMHYQKLLRLYGTEYYMLAREIFASQEERTPIMHPYAKAYIKMWKLDRDPQWRLSYHGTNLGETIEMLDILIKEGERNRKRFKRNYQNAKKKLQTKSQTLKN